VRGDAAADRDLVRLVFPKMSRGEAAAHLQVPVPMTHVS
jgi:hypothetical protein